MKIMSINSWNICEFNKKEILKYSKEWGFPAITSSILYSRGFRTEEDIEDFVRGNIIRENPFNITDMDKLVNRVKKAIENKEKICVYGDYDADGVTSTALIYLFLKSKYADVCYYVPERDRDGYGLNVNAIDFIKNLGVKLIFTVDNGVTAIKEVEYANKLGIDTVITDHHRVPKELPNAVAIVDPFRVECEKLKYKNFAGVGVAFKFVEAFSVDENISFEELLIKYGDLVTLGTIGDAVEITGETRKIVKFGLNNILRSTIPGVVALLNVSGLSNKSELDLKTVAFLMVPRINACGRMGNAELALKLLISSDISEAMKYAEKLNKLNGLRKDIEEKIFKMAEELLINEPERKHEKIIVIEGENWDHGVLGIVATRITQKYGSPCVLITYNDNMARGSCRSIGDFPLYDVLLECKELFERFGGHPLAAGFDIKTQNIDKLKQAIRESCKKTDIPSPIINISAKLNPLVISKRILDDLAILKPFGAGNPEPVFGVFNMTIKKIYSIGQGKHIKITMSRINNENNNFEMEALYFGKSKSDFLYREGDIVDIAVTFSKNEFHGIVNLSIQIVDIKLSSVDLETIIKEKKIYKSFYRDGILKGLDIPIENVIPNHEDFIKLYKYLKKEENNFLRADVINYRVYGGKESTLKIYFAIDAMEELGVATVFRSSDEYRISINKVNKKVDILDSVTLKRIKDF